MTEHETELLERLYKEQTKTSNKVWEWMMKGAVVLAPILAGKIIAHEVAISSNSIKVEALQKQVEAQDAQTRISQERIYDLISSLRSDNSSIKTSLSDIQRRLENK